MAAQSTEQANSEPEDNVDVEEPSSPDFRSATSQQRHKRVAPLAVDGRQQREAELKPHRRERTLDKKARGYIAQGIRQDRFCKNLEEKDIEAICDAAECFAWEAGDSIVKQGEEGYYFFVATEGSLDIVLNGKVIDTIGPGMSFGATAILFHCPRVATVIAKEPSITWGVAGETFTGVLKAHAQGQAAMHLDCLNNISIFGGLNAKQRDRISKMAFQPEHFDAGVRVVTEGQTLTALYFVQRGKVSCYKGGTVDGSGKLVGGTKKAEFGVGELFGDQSLLHGEDKYIFTIVTEELVDLICIGVKQLRDALGDDLVARLERGFSVSVLKRLPVLSHLSCSQRQKIAETMTSRSYSAGEAIGEDLRLVVVMDGTVSYGEVELQRGQWWADDALVELNSQPGSPRTKPLVAGPQGARLVLLTYEDLVKALQELGIESIKSSDEVIDYMRKVLIARKVPVFRGLSETQINQLINILVLKTYKKGAVVFKEGEVGHAFFVIADGEVKVTVKNEIVRTLGKGACFGERALLLDEPRSANVTVTSEKAELWSLERENFNKIITQCMHKELTYRIRLQDTGSSLKSLKHVRIIGAGAFGSVRLVEHKHTHVRYALKRVRKINGEIPDDAERERSLLAELDHPFMLQMIKTFETPASIYFLMELITGGQLYEQTNERMGLLSRKQAQFYIGALVLIMEALHDRNIVYRDLKPENVMLDEQGYLKLVDFGLAKKLDDAGRAFSTAGTLLYMAPEVLQGQGYGLEVDIWSLGVIFYELVCGCLPFGDGETDEQEVAASILEDNLKFPSRYNDSAGKKCIQGMLSKKPETRLGAGADGWEEVKTSKFFKAGVSGDLFVKITGREVDPPFIPEKEEYTREETLDVTLSDADELYSDEGTTAMREKVMSTFKKFDANGDGTIDRPELARILQALDRKTFTDAAVDKLLKVVDTNHDGRIQFEEFLAWVSSDNKTAEYFRKLGELDVHN